MLELDKSGFTRIIDRLEKFGFIKIITNQHDRCEYAIMTTEQGRLEIKKAQIVIKQINAFIESKITKERLAVFKEILDELNTIVREELSK